MRSSEAAEGASIVQALFAPSLLAGGTAHTLPRGVSPSRLPSPLSSPPFSSPLAYPFPLLTGSLPHDFSPMAVGGPGPRAWAVPLNRNESAVS